MTAFSSRHPARQRGVTVRVLNLSTYEAEALRTANDNLPEGDEPHTKAEVAQAPMALATAPDGTEYLLGVEGVGWPVTDEDNEFDVFLSKETSFSMFPSMVLSLSREQLHDALGDEVDLADHVRTFGARLDDNHAMWFGILS